MQQQQQHVRPVLEDEPATNNNSTAVNLPPSAGLEMVGWGDGQGKNLFPIHNCHFNGGPLERCASIWKSASRFCVIFEFGTFAFPAAIERHRRLLSSAGRRQEIGKHKQMQIGLQRSLPGSWRNR